MDMLSGYSRIRAKNRADKNAVYVMWAAFFVYHRINKYRLIDKQRIDNSIRCMGEYEYSSPLVAKVTFLSANFPSVPSTFWKGWIEVLPGEFKECIKADPNYAECFE